MNVNKIIESLSLEQKAALLQGWSMWTTLNLREKGVAPLFLSDGPHGLRKQPDPSQNSVLTGSVPATCFPTAATMANSWNLALGEELGAALGEEAAANDVHVLLGPGLNIKRSPLCGRNFEYFSEDPFLAGKMAAAYIRGIQSRGVAACPKHFAVNSQELRRLSVDAVLDERTLREIYLTGFEIAVTEGKPLALMSAYNRVNGVYCNENAHLLRDILRGEWGFEGFVVSDWGADNDHVEGVRAGSNLVMPAPGADCAIRLVEAVREGRLAESALDERLRELLKVMARTQPAVAKAPKTFDREAHHALARRCAEESIVLLENDGVLPLARKTRTALIGDFAETPRYQGAGSSLVNPTRLENLKDCLDRAGLNITGFARGYTRGGQKSDKSLLEGAVSLAKVSDAVLLCVGLDEILESKGMDRESLALSAAQRELIAAVCAVNPKVVLVLSGGAPFLLPKAGYRAVIHGYLGGQAGAAAMADALLGRVNPSGKLSESWPESLADTPCAACYPGRERTAEYREGLFVGYRYYETAGVGLRWPFGYGLSYTAFQYADPEAAEDAVSFTIQNTGDVAGAEVAQLYVSCPDGAVFRPNKELRGFVKVFLQPGEARRVSIPLDDKTFRYYNIRTKAWEIESGDYELCVGASVADIRLRCTVSVVREPAPLPNRELPSYRSGRVAHVPDVEFEALLQRPIPDGHRGEELDENDPLSCMSGARSGLARLLCRRLHRRVRRAEEAGAPDPDALFLLNMPFRGFAKTRNGAYSRQMVEDLLLMVNGHFWRGLGRLLRDHIRNKKASRDFMKKLEGETA